MCGRGDLWTLPTPQPPVNPWTPLTLLNGWVNYGSGFATAGYRKVGDLVVLKGLIRSGTVTTGTAIATLPAGHCPSGTTHNVTVSNAAIATINIYTNGNIVTNVGVQAAWLSLDGVVWAAEREMVTVAAWQTDLVAGGLLGSDPLALSMFDHNEIFVRGATNKNLDEDSAPTGPGTPSRPIRTRRLPTATRAATGTAERMRRTPTRARTGVR